MNIPVLDFASLWRGMRCARQLRRIIDHSSCFNPKLCGPEDIQAAVLSLPGLQGALEPDRLDWLFGQHQEKAVHGLARSLFPEARAVEGESLWQIEGETLRELGWCAAWNTGHHKTMQIHKDNWHNVLKRLPAIADGGFLEQFLWARPDYLFMESEHSWILVLVRSGTRVRDSYIAEAGFIKDVLARKQIVVTQCFLLCPNEHYLRPQAENGELAEMQAIDYFQLHGLNHPIKYQREALLAAVPRLLTAAKSDQVCDSPRSCILCGPELAPLPEHNIHTLHRGGKAIDLLENQGILNLADLERADARAKSELKDRHFIQLSSIRQNRPHVDRSGLKTFLKTIRFPLLFLDFETTSQAIPPAAGIRPWEHLPFMFSTHRAENMAEVMGMQPSSQDCLMSPTISRQTQLRQLAENLSKVGAGCNSVCVYGGALESAILARLANLYQDLAPVLIQLAENMVDLQVPFQQFHYYHPKQYGKLSLKRILPLLTGTSHDDLAMKSGGEANLTFYFLSNPDAASPDIADQFDAKAAPQKLENLRAYCAMDTMGLVHILSALFTLAD